MTDQERQIDEVKKLARKICHRIGGIMLQAGYEDASDYLYDDGYIDKEISELLDTHTEPRTESEAIKALRDERDRLREEKERLLRTIAGAAWCLLKEENGAICDTIWMPENYGGIIGMTLYDFLTGELEEIEFTADVDEDAAALKQALKGGE